MTDSSSAPLLDKWRQVAKQAFSNPLSPTDCPICRAQTLFVAWTIADLMTREATVEVICSSCHVKESFKTVLPPEVGPCFPFERVLSLQDFIRNQAEVIAERIRKHAKTMPAAAFATHPLWAEAKWSATTFHWHPTSEAPPIMGVVFDNAEAGLEIFREAERQMNHTDRFEEIRVSIVEGPVPDEGTRPGYSVHICADPEALAANATAADFVVDPTIVPFLGQWNRHYPVTGMPALLPKFKSEFAKHKEFLLAPVIRKPDGQLWIESTLGIIKNEIHFRQLSDISHDDPDAAAVLLPQFILPPES